MLVLNKVNAYIGLLLAVIGYTICPLIKVPFQGNWNLYHTDSRLFFISLALLAILALCFFVRQLSAFRKVSIVFFIWNIIMAAAVYFKSNNYFNSKFFDKILAKTINYQWGWIVILVAAILLLTCVRKGVAIKD